jgi:hypothetical protein
MIPSPRASAVRRIFAGLSLLAMVLARRAAFVRAAGLPPPPALVAMWEGKDGESVHAALRHFAADGELPGASAGQRLESGEAAWWLGVQHARAGRADSALAEWRRAMRLRGDFDEGFALMDALFRRGGTADLDEAHALAVSFAEQAPMGMPARVPEAQARLAWARHLRGHSDSAVSALGEWHDALRTRSAWTKRLATMELAAADHEGAWKSLTLLSARTRGRDAGVESLLVRAQHALHYTDERRQITVDALRGSIEAGERAFDASLGARVETLRASDGFELRWFRVPAAAPSPASAAPETSRRPSRSQRAPLLFVLAPGDSLSSADSLAASLALAGRTVILLAPRGSYGALGPATYGPEVWAGRTLEFQTTVAADAARVMDALARSGVVPAGAWLVGAAGECAPIALAVARARKDVQALLLVAPGLPIVEVAEFRARLRAMGTRTFVQVSPEEPDALELGDLLSRMTAPGQVRVADSGLPGRGVAIFRGEPKVAARLLAWLDERPARR